MHHVSGLVSPVNKMTVVLFTECLCKNIKFSLHVAAVLISTRVGSVTRVPLIIVTSRLEQWEVVDTSIIVKRCAKIRSLWRHSYAVAACRTKLTLKTKRHSRQPIGTKHKPCVTNGLKTWISIPAGQLISLIWYHLCDCSCLNTEGVTMLNRFPATTWPRRHVQWELCGTDIGGYIANLLISCYNGNNERSARVLFVQHLREQGEWLLQNVISDFQQCT